MKCTTCGFEYEREPVCPICGTRAPQEETPVSPPVSRAFAGENPYFTKSNAPTPPSPPTSPPPKRAYPAPPTPPQSNKNHHREPSRSFKIVLICLLVITMAASCVSAVFTIMNYSQNKKISNFFDIVNSMAGMNMDDYGDFSGLYDDGYLDNLENDADYIDDTTTRKIGDTFDFEYGTITAVSAAATGKEALNDSDMVQYAFTFELKNTTDKRHRYIPYIWMDNCTELYSESTVKADYDETAISLEAGNSATVVFYFNVPKSKTTISADCDIEDTQSIFWAHTVFEFDLTKSKTQ